MLVASCCLHCVKQLLSAEPGSSNTDVIDDEDAAEKPYNDLRVIRRALTAATQTDQMEAAWGHDPRWQVCVLCNFPSPSLPPALASSSSCSGAWYPHLLMVQSVHALHNISTMQTMPYCCVHETYKMLTSACIIEMVAFRWLHNTRTNDVCIAVGHVIDKLICIVTSSAFDFRCCRHCCHTSGGQCLT